MENDRRQYKRFMPEEIAADYKVLNPDFWAAFRARGKQLLQNISLGGVSFLSDEQLPHDSVLHLKFQLGTMAHFFEMCGRIVRVRALSPQQYEIGVTFSWWGNEQDKIALMKHFKER